jgi:hypothetical protein
LRQVGNVALELANGRRSDVLELIAGHHRDGYRNLLQGLLSPPRGDGDLAGKLLPLNGLLDRLLLFGHLGFGGCLFSLLGQRRDRHHQQDGQCPHQ